MAATKKGKRTLYLYPDFYDVDVLGIQAVLDRRTQKSPVEEYSRFRKPEPVFFSDPVYNKRLHDMGLLGRSNQFLFADQSALDDDFSGWVTDNSITGDKAVVVMLCQQMAEQMKRAMPVLSSFTFFPFDDIVLLDELYSILENRQQVPLAKEFSLAEIAQNVGAVIPDISRPVSRAYWVKGIYEKIASMLTIDTLDVNLV